MKVNVPMGNGEPANTTTQQRVPHVLLQKINLGESLTGHSVVGNRSGYWAVRREDVYRDDVPHNLPLSSLRKRGRSNGLVTLPN